MLVAFTKQMVISLFAYTHQNNRRLILILQVHAQMHGTPACYLHMTNSIRISTHSMVVGWSLQVGSCPLFPNRPSPLSR